MSSKLDALSVIQPVPEKIGAPRIIFIDVAKGIAISLVVFGHVLGGALGRNWVVPAAAAQIAYKFIYMFHMPFFFFVSGAFAIGHIRRSPVDAFLSRCGSIAWPYLLWSTIFALSQVAFVRFMSYSPADLGPVAALQRIMLGETYWFLWALFLCQMLLIATTTVVPTLAVFACSIVAAIVLEKYDLATFANIVHFMPFLTLGALVGNQVRDIRVSSTPLAFLIAALMFAGLLVYAACGSNDAFIIQFATGIIGTIATLLLAGGLTTTSGVIASALKKAGEASLVIFLLHSYFQAGARLLVEHIAGPALSLQLVIPTLAGIVGPVMIWMVAERAGLQWMFRLRPIKARDTVYRPDPQT